jgi:hypothetical protein
MYMNYEIRNLIVVICVDVALSVFRYMHQFAIGAFCASLGGALLVLAGSYLCSYFGVAGV